MYEHLVQRLARIGPPMYPNRGALLLKMAAPTGVTAFM